MKKKVKLIILFFILVIGLFCYKSFANKNKDLDKILTNKINKEMFAIMVNNGNGEYQEQSG